MNSFLYSSILFIFINFSIYGINLQSLLQYIPGMHTSFFAEVSFETTEKDDASVITETAVIYYKYPDSMHIRFASGKIIATNGKFVWLYNPKSLICIKESVEKESTEGFLKMLINYTVSEVLDGKKRRLIFTKSQSPFDEISMLFDKKILLEINFKEQSKTKKLVFHSIKSDIEFQSSLFHYKPPFFIQVIENILN